MPQGNFRQHQLSICNKRSAHSRHALSVLHELAINVRAEKSGSSKKRRRWWGCCWQRSSATAWYWCRAPCLRTCSAGCARRLTWGWRRCHPRCRWAGWRRTRVRAPPPAASGPSSTLWPGLARTGQPRGATHTCCAGRLRFSSWSTTPPSGRCSPRRSVRSSCWTTTVSCNCQPERKLRRKLPAHTLTARAVRADGHVLRPATAGDGSDGAHRSQAFLQERRPFPPTSNGDTLTV